MNTHTLVTASAHVLRRSRLAQIGLLAAFWGLGESLARLTGLPLPGAVLGMILLLALFGSKLVKPALVERGASWLLAEMLLFFVPAVLAVLDHREFLSILGLKILAVIVLGTTLVMGTTALAVDCCIRLRERHGR